MKTLNVLYNGKPVELRSTGAYNPYVDEYHICKGGVPVRAVTLPKGWEPSARIIVNGIQAIK